MAGYLTCVSCSHEWADPDYVEEKKVNDIPIYHRDAELIEQFKRDVIWQFSKRSRSQQESIRAARSVSRTSRR